MAQNASVEAYERLIAATRSFKKKNLEIAKELLNCSNVAITAMNGDTTSTELKKVIDKILKKMSDIDDQTEVLKKNLEDTRDLLLEI
jgi:cell division GTPase FtsZ